AVVTFRSASSAVRPLLAAGLTAGSLATACLASGAARSFASEAGHWMAVSDVNSYEGNDPLGALIDDDHIRSSESNATASWVCAGVSALSGLLGLAATVRLTRKRTT
ncbi:MAG: hypothetical protein KC492_05405, partial [Myxococcales bacterium]|nr:hypothetical protein [Myxococcales bacterium]